ncbi:MAG TPA: DUF4254 domain-containing protein [Acidimicrobiia bacterium]
MSAGTEGGAAPGPTRDPAHGGELPPVTAVVAEFRASMVEADPRRPNGLLGVLHDLHQTNLEQWSWEDRVRSCDGDDSAIAVAKRAIDGLNARRHELVEAIDAAINTAVTQQPAATPSTESPGMAFDRLSVLVIRIHHTEAAVAGGHDATDLRARLPLLETQVAVLEEAIEALLSDIRAGTRRFLPHQSLKLYRP